MPDENGRVTLRELIEQRFDSLEETLKKDREAAKEKAADHETRIRLLEKRITWSNFAQGAANMLGIVLGALGIRNP